MRRQPSLEENRAPLCSPEPMLAAAGPLGRAAIEDGGTAGGRPGGPGLAADRVRARRPARAQAHPRAARLPAR